MDINSQKGTRIKVTKESIKNGTDTDKARAKEMLRIGGIYTVVKTVVSNWHTDVYIEEYPGIPFNSVQFEEEE